MESDQDVRKTLFVRNLSFDTTNEKLEEIFGDIGPIKSCFVVKDKESGKCRGFGYVKYSMKEDAETAKKTVKEVSGRQVFIHYADKKPKQKKGKKQPATDEDGNSVDVSVEEKTPKKITPPPKSEKTESGRVDTNSLIKEKHRAACTVIVKNFSPESFEKDVRSVLIGQKNQRQVHYPVPEREEDVAAILFKSKRDALKGAKRLDKMKIKGQQICAQLLSVERAVATKAPPKPTPKRNRLIVRNLAFACKENKLKEIFSKFGEVTEVNIPKLPNGRMMGCGFVQFATISEANKALTEMNAQAVLGRPVAVDWAVSKDRYEKVAEKTAPIAESSDSGSYSSGEDAESKSRSKNSRKEHSMDISDRSEDEDSESDDDSTSRNKKMKRDVSDDSDSEEELEDEQSMEVEAGGSDSEPSGEDEESESEVDSTEKKVKGKQSDTDSDSSDDEGFSDNLKEPPRKKPPQKSDVNQGKTIFIRNLSYDTEEDDLGGFFEQFGELVYCRIVVDPVTDHSRGTAFVQFKNKLDAEKALEVADSKGEGLTLDGRRLNLSPAIERETANKIQADKNKKEEKDNRNLYLAREGLIRGGTKDAEGLSTDDLNKRRKVEDMKRQKLKNPNIFISDKRLCLRNIPVTVDDQALRKILLKTLADKHVKITECRIMRDLTRVNTKGVAKSRGYGFVSFTEHKHALMALRLTNNNAAIFGEKKRLIVEFSLENQSALAAKELRIQRAKAKEETLKKGKTTFADVKVKKRNKRDDRRTQPKILPAKKDDDNEMIKDPPKKGPKGMPSHWGPKVRHRDRGKNAKTQNRQNQRRQQNRDTQQKRKREKINDKPKKRAKKGEIRDNFDDLVSKYKKQFSKTATKAGNKSKWFA